jgi:heme/copper-type cytochrome/quinol oxidase subunit 3
MIIFYIRDSLREYKSNYVVLGSMKISSNNWCILSESAVFSLLFWITYENILSPLQMIINLWIGNILLNSYELSLKSTNILSNNSVIFGNQYISDVIHEVNTYQCYLCSQCFLNNQMNEFTNLSNNMNDTLYDWIFYCVDGWHLYHIVVGNVLMVMCLILWSCYVFIGVVMQLRVRLHHMLYNMQIVYWHFVELLWLVIYSVLYS